MEVWIQHLAAVSIRWTPSSFGTRTCQTHLRFEIKGEVSYRLVLAFCNSLEEPVQLGVMISYVDGSG